MAPRETTLILRLVLPDTGARLEVPFWRCTCLYACILLLCAPLAVSALATSGRL